MMPSVSPPNRNKSGDYFVINSYFPINGLNLYYEIHGSGKPLVLLHGGMTDISTSFGTVLPTLAEQWQVVAIEQQGHGHTADIDRPLSYTQMVEDTAALLHHLDVGEADIFGYSDGGIIALGLAIHHPDLIRKVVVGGANFNNEGLYPEILQSFHHPDPDGMGPLRDFYEAVAPRPEDWPTLVNKVTQMALDYQGWPREALQQISAPTLVVVGDGDIVKPEHAVELFRLIPKSNLAVLPRTDHFLRLLTPEWILSMVIDFLNAPLDDDTGAQW